MCKEVTDDAIAENVSSPRSAAGVALHSGGDSSSDSGEGIDTGLSLTLITMQSASSENESLIDYMRTRGFTSTCNKWT